MTTTTELPVTSAPTRNLTGDASAAAFLLGGIGAGNVSIGARGELRDWEIFNSPAKGQKLPFTFFAVRVAREGAEPIVRVLESRLRAPHESWTGYPPESVAGLPRLTDSRLRGEYPFVSVDFLDDELPVVVSLEAFTPLVPLDAEASGLPAAVLRYRVRNPTDTAVEVSIAASLFNPIGWRAGTDTGFQMAHVDGTPETEFRVDGELQGLFMTSSLPTDDLAHGTVTVLTTGGDVTARPRWPIDSQALSEFWADLERDGRLEPAPESTPTALDQEALMVVMSEEALAMSAKLHVGSLANTATIAPDQELTFEFVLAWHFPNRPKGWAGPHEVFFGAANDDVIHNHYANRFDDAWQVAKHLREGLPVLESDSRAFRDSLYDSTLPPEVIDAVASNITVLRSTTCFWLEDGTFAGWEGCMDNAGSCPGTCTHVWSYAQTLAFLFPELERSMRRVEFGLETDEEGLMQFRSNRLFGGQPWTFLPATDGQLGSIIRLYREWKFSGDDAFLAELWPHAARALEFAFDYWDTDGDFVLDGRQHNTYDIEFYGPNPLSCSLFYAGLRAGAAMAEQMGDSARAERFSNAATVGAEKMDRLLYNGEYYIQLLDDVDANPNQHGIGCLSDQLLGQLEAHVTGLGYVLPPDHVKQAIASVHRYNFRPNLRGHLNYLRTYALDDEGGLVLCSWPHGGRPRRPFAFSDEVWTGIEYQVAAHLIYEGLVDEGLEIVRAVRDRHDGYKRSPWNEAECGSHYARSMASWALLLAYSGVYYDATKQTISFAPVAGGDFRCFFSTGTGWGTFERTGASAKLGLRWGSLVLSELTVDETTRNYDTPVTLSAGDVLQIELG